MPTEVPFAMNEVKCKVKCTVQLYNNNIYTRNTTYYSYTVCY